MPKLTDLLEVLKSHFGENLLDATFYNKELTLEIKPTALHSICLALRDKEPFAFETLIDICGIDYQTYGVGEWVTESATHTGFDRAVGENETTNHSTWSKPRFGAIYHLLSIQHNHRLRLRALPSTDSPEPESEISPTLDTVTDIWPSANWYEREAFDLFGIHFKGHPDQRRLLTDYNFEGHPFRKDFPLIGKTEVRYDAKTEQVIYEPVTSVIPRTVIPKVTRANTQNTSDFDKTLTEH